MEYTIDGYCVEWQCDCCGTVNVDWFNWTDYPGCIDCDEYFDWDQILSQAEINTLLAKLDPDRYAHLGDGNR